MIATIYARAITIGALALAGCLGGATYRNADGRDIRGRGVLPAGRALDDVRRHATGVPAREGLSAGEGLGWRWVATETSRGSPEGPAMLIRMILTALLVVLTLASSAWAECAWVMWNRANEQAALEAWTIVTAFGNRKACVRELSSRAKDWKKSGWTIGFEGDARITAKSNAGVYEVICLPDSTDPRWSRRSAL
jgi:hypothetical protein